jgi:hypothetical protein
MFTSPIEVRLDGLRVSVPSQIHTSVLTENAQR